MDGAALLDALDAGGIAGAALDVLPSEPPAEDDAVFRRACEMGSLIVTPHIAWASEQAMQNLADQLVESVNRFFNGEAVKNLAL